MTISHQMIEECIQIPVHNISPEFHKILTLGTIIKTQWIENKQLKMTFSFLGVEMCPVSLFKLYIEKLHPNCPYLWQKPKTGYLHYTDPIWYEPWWVGHDPLDRFMHFLSTTVGPSKNYMNHSIQATVITTLDSNGVEARHIINLSSHKNESTIKEYAWECPERKWKEI